MPACRKLKTLRYVTPKRVLLCTDAPTHALRGATLHMQIGETKPVVEEEPKKNSCRPAKQGREQGPTVPYREMPATAALGHAGCTDNGVTSSREGCS